MNLVPIQHYFDPEKNIPAAKLVLQVLQILKRRFHPQVLSVIPRIRHIINGSDVPLGTPHFYQAAIDTNGLIQIISDGKSTIISFDGTRLSYEGLLFQLNEIIDGANALPPTRIVWNWVVDFLKSRENTAVDLAHYDRPRPDIRIDDAIDAHIDLDRNVRQIITPTATYYIYLK